MVIEPGDLFVVTRGVPLREPDDFWRTQDDVAVAQRYERSHDGRIYRALSVEDSSIVARCEYDNYRSSTMSKVGKAILLNATELVLDTVSEGHLRVLLDYQEREKKDGG